MNNKWIVKYNVGTQKIVDIKNKPFDKQLNSNGYWYHLDEGKTIENIIFYVDMDRIKINKKMSKHPFDTFYYNVLDKIVRYIKNHIRNVNINKLNGADPHIFKQILKDKDNVSNIDDINIISYQFETTRNDEGFSVYYSICLLDNWLKRYTTFIPFKEYNRHNNLNKIINGTNTD